MVDGKFTGIRLGFVMKISERAPLPPLYWENIVSPDAVSRAMKSKIL